MASPEARGLTSLVSTGVVARALFVDIAFSFAADACSISEQCSDCQGENMRADARENYDHLPEVAHDVVTKNTP